MGIFGAAIKGFGKALKASKRKKRRKDLGLPERTKLQQRSAAGFVKRRKQLGGPKAVMPVKKAMGGEAGESLRKGQIFKEKRDKRRNEVDEMIERLYGPGIKPKKKPKNLDKIRPKTKPKKPQESIMKKRNDFARMLYSRADKLSGTARQTAIKKADDFIRYIDVQNKRPVRPRSKVKK